MTVAIVKTKNPKDVRRAVELLGGMEKFVDKGERVIVKPNICAAMGSETGAVTDPLLVAEVAKMVAECGAEPIVVESPIYPVSSQRAFRKAGYADFEQRYGFELVDANAAEAIEVEIPRGLAIDHTIIPRVVLEADKLINVPVIKTHLQTTFSLGMKNLKGLVVGKQKHLIHLCGLDQGIVDLNTLIKSNLVIMDGIIGMEGTGGPTNGRAVEMDVVLAGNDVVEADCVGVRIMSGDPEKVKHIQLACEQGLGATRELELLGDDLESVAAKRDLPKFPDLSRTLISGVALRALDAFREVSMRLLGGERVEKSVKLGDPVIDYEACNKCKLCLEACPVDAIEMKDFPMVRLDDCIRCFCCAEVCSKGAISKKS